MKETYKPTPAQRTRLIEAWRFITENPHLYNQRRWADADGRHCFIGHVSRMFSISVSPIEHRSITDEAYTLLGMPPRVLGWTAWVYRHRHELAEFVKAMEDGKIAHLQWNPITNIHNMTYENNPS